MGKALSMTFDPRKFNFRIASLWSLEPRVRISVRRKHAHLPDTLVGERQPRQSIPDGTISMRVTQGVAATNSAVGHMAQDIVQSFAPYKYTPKPGAQAAKDGTWGSFGGCSDAPKDATWGSVGSSVIGYAPINAPLAPPGIAVQRTTSGYRRVPSGKSKLQEEQPIAQNTAKGSTLPAVSAASALDPILAAAAALRSQQGQTSRHGAQYLEGEHSGARSREGRSQSLQKQLVQPERVTINLGDIGLVAVAAGMANADETALVGAKGGWDDESGRMVPRMQPDADATWGDSSQNIDDVTWGNSSQALGSTTWTSQNIGGGAWDESSQNLGDDRAWSQDGVLSHLVAVDGTWGSEGQQHSTSRRLGGGGHLSEGTWGQRSNTQSNTWVSSSSRDSGGPSDTWGAGSTMSMLGTLDAANILGGIGESEDLLYLINYPTEHGGLPYETETRTATSDDFALGAEQPEQPRVAAQPSPSAVLSQHAAQRREQPQMQQAGAQAGSCADPIEEATQPSSVEPPGPQPLIRIPSSLAAAQQAAIRCARRRSPGSATNALSRSGSSVEDIRRNAPSALPPALSSVRERLPPPENFPPSCGGKEVPGRVLPPRPERRSIASNEPVVSTREKMERTSERAQSMFGPCSDGPSASPLEDELPEAPPSPSPGASHASSGRSTPEETERLLAKGS